MRGICYFAILIATTCLPCTGQTTWSGVGSASANQRSVKYWLDRGKAAIAKVNKKRHAELHALVAVTYAKVGNTIAATRHIHQALNGFATTPEDERHLVRTEIARAWTWVGQDEKAMGVALLSSEDADVTDTMIRIAAAQHERGDVKAASTTFDMVEQSLRNYSPGDWHQQTMYADLASTFALTSQMDRAHKTLKLIKLPSAAIDGACWVAFAEACVTKPDVKKIRATAKELETRLTHLDPDDVEPAACSIAEVYARVDDVESAHRVMRSIKDAGMRSYCFATIAAAHARVKQRDAFGKAIHHAFAAVKEINDDADSDRDVSYDKAWSLGSIAWTMVADGDVDDITLVYQQAESPLEQAFVAIQIAEALADAQRAKK